MHVAAHFAAAALCGFIAVVAVVAGWIPRRAGGGTMGAPPSVSASPGGGAQS